MGRQSSIEGRALGAYRLDRRLGAGGIGAVYAATHVRTGRGYAVKVLLPEAADDATAAARFRREAEALAAVGHPGIVAVHDFDVTDDGVAYLVMDKLEGEDLDARLARGPLSLASALALLREVGAALAAAHDAGVLHRDLKPSNIFLARRPGAPEHAVLLDFGLAKLMEGEHAKLTATGATMGTPMYMSPEQAQGLPVDRRTDVYALAAVLFECLTARPPFDGPNVTAILAKVLTQPPPRLREYDPTLPKALEEVIVRAMAKDALERPPSVPALLAAVTAAAGDAPSDRTPALGARALPATQATPVVVEVKRPTTSRTRLWAGGLAALALVTGGVAVAWLSRPEPPRAVTPVVAPVPVEHPPRGDDDTGADAGVDAGAEEASDERVAPPSATTKVRAPQPARAPRADVRVDVRADVPVDLAPLGAAGTLAQLPRARAVLDRELRDHALPRPEVCAYPADDAPLEILPGARDLVASLATARVALCRTTPALEADRRAHGAAVAALRAHLERLQAAAQGR